MILAVTGSAVGLGNFLRFPGLAAQYEGGIFMIPYFISLILLGLPLAWVEWAMGRYGGLRGHNSCPGIFRVLWRNRASPYFGMLGLLVPVVIYMYYVYIESWCLGYAWYYLTGALNLGKDAEAYGEFFARFVGLGEDGQVFHGGEHSALPFLLVCIGLNFLLIYRGLSRGIELFCLWAMPALVLCALIVLVRVLTLGTPNPEFPEQNVIGGLAFMWEPRIGEEGLLAALSNGEMWLKAAGQIFFSLSVGFGVIITYSSYLKRKDDIALSSTTAVAGNQFCEVALGGLITIPAAFVFLGAMQTQEISGSSFDLGFKALPLVFESMPAGQWFGFLWFFLLFLAAVTSSLSMLQPAIAFLEEGLGLNRKVSVIFLGFITLAGNGLVVYFTEGFAALDTMDFWVGTFCIFILATIQVILFGWVLGTEKGMAELREGSDLRIPGWVAFVIKYVSPTYLLIIFAVWVQQTFKERLQVLVNDKTVLVTVGFILAVAGLFLMLISQAVRRWDRINPLEKLES